MAKIRELLKHVSVERATGTRRCKRNRQHEIPMGDWCVVIRDEGSPCRRVYCHDCALPMFKLCCAKLREFRDTLYPELSRQRQAKAPPSATSDDNPDLDRHAA